MINLLITGASAAVARSCCAALPLLFFLSLTLRPLVGKELDASSRTGLMDIYFSRLQQLAASKKLAARLRFMCRDVIDLRKNNWVPRREKLQAKKLDEVRADAAVALGMVKPQDENLFPEGPNGPTDDGWSVAGKRNKPKVEEGYSALTGQYVPSTDARLPSDRPRRDAKPAATTVSEADAPAVATEPAAAAKPKSVSKLSSEEVEEQCMKLFEEYKVAADLNEALLCVKDIQERSPDASAAGLLVCTLAIQQVIDESAERLAEQMAKLLVHLCSSGVVEQEVLLASLLKQLEQLDDVAIDVPMAPKLLGLMLASVLSAHSLDATHLRTACEAVGDMHCRRDLAVVVLKYLGDGAAVFAASVPLAEFLTDDDENLESLKTLFSKKGLHLTL